MNELVNLLINSLITYLVGRPSWGQYVQRAGGSDGEGQVID